MRCYDLLASNNLIGGSATSQTWNCMRASLNFSRAPMFASWVLIITFVSIFVCVVSISLNVRCFVYNVHSCYFMCDSLGIYIIWWCICTRAFRPSTARAERPEGDGERERERSRSRSRSSSSSRSRSSIMCMNMYPYGIPWYTMVYLYTCMHVGARIQIYIYMYVYIYICVNIYIYKCVCMYICIYDNKWHHIYNHGQTTSTRAPQELGLKRRRCGVEFRSRPRGQS